jgi:hypothetical protein
MQANRATGIPWLDQGNRFYDGTPKAYCALVLEGAFDVTSTQIRQRSLSFQPIAHLVGTHSPFGCSDARPERLHSIRFVRYGRVNANHVPRRTLHFLARGRRLDGGPGHYFILCIMNDMWVSSQFLRGTPLGYLSPECNAKRCNSLQRPQGTDERMPTRVSDGSP